MAIFQLPEDIIAERKGEPERITFHDYTAPVGSFKGKSILNKNAISLVISGEKTMHFAEKKVQIKDGEFHFLSSGNCLVSMHLSEKIPFKSILIFFDNATLTNFFVKYNDRIANLKIKAPASEPYIAFIKDAFVLNFMDSLRLLLQSQPVISEEMKQIKFEELMLHLLEQYPERLLSFQTVKTKDFDDLEIRKTVESNVTSQISIDEMAFLCNTSLSTFKRRFSKIYGTSPNKWMLQKRMELAKNLLIHHQAKPSDIYYKVGYENHSSFTQLFKQTYGLTPKDYQLQHLNVQP